MSTANQNQTEVDVHLQKVKDTFKLLLGEAMDVGVAYVKQKLVGNARSGKGRLVQEKINKEVKKANAQMQKLIEESEERIKSMMSEKEKDAEVKNLFSKLLALLEKVKHFITETVEETGETISEDITTQLDNIFKRMDDTFRDIDNK